MLHSLPSHLVGDGNFAFAIRKTIEQLKPPQRTGLTLYFVYRSEEHNTVVLDICVSKKTLQFWYIYRLCNF